MPAVTPALPKRLVHVGTLKVEYTKNAGWQPALRIGFAQIDGAVGGYEGDLRAVIADFAF
jgi:hypothetical protein